MLTVVLCALLSQIPIDAPSPGEGGSMGSFGRGAQVRWRAGRQ